MKFFSERGSRGGGSEAVSLVIAAISIRRDNIFERTCFILGNGRETAPSLSEVHGPRAGPGRARREAQKCTVEQPFFCGRIWQKWAAFAKVRLSALSSRGRATRPLRRATKDGDHRPLGAAQAARAASFWHHGSRQTPPSPRAQRRHARCSGAADRGCNRILLTDSVSTDNGLEHRGVVSAGPAGCTAHHNQDRQPARRRAHCTWNASGVPRESPRPFLGVPIPGGR